MWKMWVSVLCVCASQFDHAVLNKWLLVDTKLKRIQDTPAVQNHPGHIMTQEIRPDSKNAVGCLSWRTGWSVSQPAFQIGSGWNAEWLFFKCIEHIIGAGDGGGKGHITQKTEKYLSGNYHVKFGHFVKFSCIYSFGQECLVVVLVVISTKAFFISQSIVVKLCIQIFDNIVHNRTMAEFQVKSLIKINF